MRTVSPRTRRGGQLLGGRGWSSAAWLVRPELCHARVFLDSASWRGMTRVSPRPRCALCHPTFEAGPSFGDGRGWSSATQFVRPELYHARVFLDSASWRGMTRVPPRLRCALCHPALDAGSRESRREIYSRSLLSVSLDSASWRGMTECRRAKCHGEHKWREEYRQKGNADFVFLRKSTTFVSFARGAGRHITT